MCIWVLLVAGAVLVSGSVLREKPSHHESMSPNELNQVFGVNHQDEVFAYNSIEILPLWKRGFYQNESEKSASLKLNAFGTELHLKLSLNDDFIAKSHVIEFVKADGTIERYSGTPGQYSSGFVDGDEHSHVALMHNEKGSSGAVRTKRDLYFINPVPKRVGSDNQHIIFRKSDLSTDHPLQKSRCGFEGKKVTSDASSKRSRRSLDAKPKKTMEIMMAADYQMVEHYTKDFLPTYMLAMANILAQLYKDTTLEYNIDVVVTRTTIFESNKFPSATIHTLLGKFSDWVIKNNNPDDNSPDHVDNAILLTRNACDDGCELEGLAFDALCTSKAQSVVKDRGLMSALTVAHEVAHNLGTLHDGRSDVCPDGVNIMTTQTSSGTKAFHWSSCSSNEIKIALESHQSSCFDDVPAVHYSNSTFMLYGTVFNGDKQCSYAFSEEYGSCSSYQSDCTHLYCQIPNAKTCKSLAYPPAHGTQCGPHKYCIYAECVPDGTSPPEPVDGMWGAWSNYTVCNHDCGIGVQWRNRECNNPSRANGGADCVGESKGHYKTCNTQACPDGSASFRLEQCQNFGAKLGKSYVDLYDANRQCQLVCGNDAEAYYFGQVLDATKCTPDGSSNDLCINGVCQSVGCDIQLNSGKSFDRCQVCDGLGNTCELYSGEDMNKYATPNQYKVTDIPVGAFNIEVKENSGTMNFLGFSVDNEDNLAIRLPAYSTTYYLEDTEVYYDMEGWHYPDKLIIVKELPLPITIYLLNFYQVESKGISWKYYGDVVNGSQTKPSYAWIPQEWQECSKTCGGGIQYRDFSCVRSDDNSNVKTVQCELIEKPAVSQTCNDQDCSADWFLTEWSTCTKSCGSGTHTRELYCAAMTKDGREKLADEECDTDKPEIVVFDSCNVVMCPAEWKATEWSQCSKSCGGGVMTRTVTCERINSDGNLATVNELNCNHAPRLESSIGCNEDTECPEWKVLYSSCSATCGGGVEKPTLGCYSPTNVAKQFKDSLCNANLKPTTALNSRSCNTVPCEQVIWVTKIGLCSVTCGNGTMRTTVECQNEASHVKMDEKLCTEKKPNPPSILPCHVGICPHSFQWEEEVGVCSKTCGGGTKTSFSICILTLNQTEVDDIYCDAAVRPSITSSPCNQEVCPVTYNWAVTPGLCSVTCGDGVISAIFTCQRSSDLHTVSSDMCEGSTKPSAADKVCQMGECPPTFSWQTKYLPCSVTCGEGVEVSYVECVRDTDNAKFDAGACANETKPLLVENRACVLSDCPPPFYWSVKYGSCVATCGQGFHTRAIECHDTATNNTVSDESCRGLELPSDKPCEVQACEPAFTSTLMPDVYAIGCFLDNPEPRRIKNLIKVYDRTTSASILVENCALEAYTSGYEYFGLQYSSECWAGDESVASTYHLSGVSYGCVDGVGGEGTNFVYRIGSPVVAKSLPPIISHGCFRDDLRLPRPVPVLVGSYRNMVKSDFSNANDVITACATTVFNRGWSLFSMQYAGECWSGENTQVAYKRAGALYYRCKHGLGGVNANSVYSFYF